MATAGAQTVLGILTSNNAVLAPMAGVTDAPFRAICKHLGAGLTYTEMVSAIGLHYSFKSRKAREILTFAPEEVPCAVQLYGGDPAVIAQQAANIMEHFGENIALLDINMGCPVHKVVRRGEGSGLMLDPERASDIVARTIAAVDVPVTVKFRAGWDDDSRNAPEFAAAMEQAGAAAVAVHGRTREQFYRGDADWDVIAQVKQAVSVPVLGSGDVFTAQDAADMLAHTGVDAVMVARGAQHNPWIFGEIRSLLDTGVLPEPATWDQRLDLTEQHARALVEAYGERSAMARMRKHVIWYTSGMPDATTVRGKVNSIATLAELDALISGYRAFLREAA